MDNTTEQTMQDEMKISNLTNFINTQFSAEERIQMRYLFSVLDFKQYGTVTLSQFKQATLSK